MSRDRLTLGSSIINSVFIKKCIKQRYLLLMVLPGFLIVLIFHYIPIYGIAIAFENYKLNKGILGSEWVGLKYFEMFINGPMTVRLFRNSLLLSLYSLLWSFPAPIILTLLLNEIRHSLYKRLVQTISYIPHFISVVVVVGIVVEFSSVDGIFNQIRGLFGLKSIPLLAYKQYFRTLYIASGVWQSVGWGTIIYLAALSGANTALYDAADIDGANRWHKMINISWPTIKPTTIILFILNMGNILKLDFQKVLLMQNDNIMEVADVINTYVYREGILGARFEYTTAIGLMLNVISFIFVLTANYISRKVSENSLW